MRICHNLNAIHANNEYEINRGKLSKKITNLATGYQINCAADDAAGLAVSQKMRARMHGLMIAERNIKEGTSLLEIGDSGMAEIHNMTNRIKELCVQSANGTYSSSEREEIQAEIDALTEEIDRIANTANFNGIHMLLKKEGIGNGDGNNAGGADSYDSVINELTPYTEGSTIFGENIDLNYAVVDGKIVVSGTHNGNPIGSKQENQNDNFAFNKVFGGSNNDSLRSVTRTSDGGYFIIGTTNSFDGDLEDKNGNFTTIDTSCAEHGTGTGNVVPITPQKTSPDEYWNKVWALKLDANGNKEWSRVVGKNTANNNACKGVELENGGFAIVSSISANNNQNHSELQYTVLTADGDYILDRTQDAITDAYYYGGTNDLIPVDDGFIVVGYQKITSSNSHTQGYIIKIDFNGNIVNKKLLGGETDSSDNAVSVVKTATGYAALLTSRNGNHAQAGTSYSGGSDFMLVNMDNDFNIINTTMYGSSGNDSPASISATPDGGYIVLGTIAGVGGSIESTHGGDDLGVLRFDSNGNLLWQKTYGGTGNESARKIITNADGTYTLLATTTSDNTGDVGESLGNTDGWIVQIDDTGTILNARNIGSAGNDDIRGLEYGTDGSYVIGGTVDAVGDDVGDDNAVIKGKTDMWIASFVGFSDKTIEVELDNIVLEWDDDGNPSRWIAFDNCTSVLTGDGKTVKSLNINAHIATPEGIEEGDEGSIILQVGPDKENTFIIQRCDMRTSVLFDPYVDATDVFSANQGISTVTKAIDKISRERGKFGAYSNALEHIKNNVSNSTIQLTDAESRIRDTDMAKEMMEYIKSSVLMKASQSMLSQANIGIEPILQLLRP